MGMPYYNTVMFEQIAWEAAVETVLHGKTKSQINTAYKVLLGKKKDRGDLMGKLNKSYKYQLKLCNIIMDSEPMQQIMNSMFGSFKI